MVRARDGRGLSRVADRLLAQIQIGACAAQVADHGGIVRVTALDELSGTGAKVSDDTLIGDVDDPPVGTGIAPTGLGARG